MERKNTIILTVIAVATLLVALVGASFAYFSASVSGNGNTTNENTSTINTAVLASVEYNNDKNFKLDNAFPGAKGVQSFSVTPTGDNGAKGKYVITLTPNTNNTLLSHIKYTLYKTKKADATTNEIIVENVGTTIENNQYYATDTFKTNGVLTTVKTGELTSTTAVTLDTVPFTMGVDSDAYTYYLTYEFVNDSTTNQNSEMGKNFGAKVTVSLANPTE